MIFNNIIKNEIKKQALENIPNEVCGLLLNVSGNLTVYPCENISYYKYNHAIINPLDYVRASKTGEIIGYYHSHENNGISMTDNLSALSHNIYSIIYSWKYDKFFIIDPNLIKYLNKDFKIGENDCYSLIRNYYKNSKNIEFKDYYRDENWNKINPNIIIDGIKEENVIEVNINDIKNDDILIFEINNILSHFAIYLGNNLILHHPRKQKSIISELNEPLLKRLKLVLRYKNE